MHIDLPFTGISFHFKAWVMALSDDTLTTKGRRRYLHTLRNSVMYIIDILWTSEMPEALRPTHGSQVGWGRVNLVAIGPLRWSRYSLPSTSPASDGPCAQERRLAETRIQMEATVCSRQRALAADFRRNMPHSPKAKDHSRAKKCIAADLGRLATDNDQ